MTLPGASQPEPSQPHLSQPVPAQAALAQPEPRRRRTGLVAGIVAALLAAGGGVTAVLLLRPAAGPAATATGTTTAAATSAPAEVKYTGPLRELAIPMPAGAVRETLRMGAADGTLTLNDVLAEYDESDRASLRKTLTDLEFERGVFLAWTDPQGFLVYLQIYQFRFTREAAAWSVAEAGALNDSAQSTAAIVGIEGARWFSNTTPSGRSAAHARYIKGDLAVMLSIFKSGATDIEYLKRLAVDQYGRLPKSG